MKSSDKTPSTTDVPLSIVDRLFTPRLQLFIGSAAGALLLLGFLASRAGLPGVTPGLYWVSLGMGMVYAGKAALDSLRDREFNIDVLMIVAAGLAAFMGHPQEGSLLLVLFTVAGALEQLAMERSQRDIRALHQLLPASALVERGGQWVTLHPEELLIGELIRVRPGERVPVDCTVLSGHTTIDTSAITGESKPRETKVGDEVFAGTINLDDPIDAHVTRVASESGVQRILNLVTVAQEQRGRLHSIIERISQPYAIGVFLASIAVVVVWRYGFGVPLMTVNDQAGALSTAITFLIVASPCALVIATPTATLAALSRGARGGILFKGGDSLDRLATTNALCFDKTGTLTYGRPRLYEVHPVAWSDSNRLLAMAAGLEQDSTHPIASAIRDAAVARSIEPSSFDEIDHVQARGIQGRQGNMLVRLGRYSYVEEIIPVCFRNRVKDVLRKIQDRGHVAVTIALQNSAEPTIGEVAVLIMADSVRPGSQHLVQRLHDLHIAPVRMLTGDNHFSAQKIAKALNLDAFDADLLPEDKLRIIKEMSGSLHASGQPLRVGIIGDGVNDAPAIASAHASLAMGGIGSGAALDSADSVLLSDDLTVIPWAIALARRTRRVIQINLLLALSVMVIMSAVTLIGSRVGYALPMGLGVLAHEGGTILVVFHSLTLLFFRSPVEALSDAGVAGSRKLATIPETAD